MYSPVLLMITTFGEAHGNVEGRIILADSSRLIVFANFRETWALLAVLSAQLGSLLPRQYRISPPCGWKECVPITNKKVLDFQIICLNSAWPSVSGTRGSPT